MKEGRNINVDLLRGLCAYVVVFIHTPGDSSRLFWLSVLPPANAVFAMLAGWYMLTGLTCCKETSQETKQGQEILSWLKERGHRILLPYAFWSLIYIGLNIALDALLRRPSNFNFHSVGQWVSIILLGRGATQLWFLVTLFYAQALLYAYWILVDFLSKHQYVETSRHQIRGVVYALKMGGVLVIASICFYLYAQCYSKDQFPATFYFMAKFLFLGAFLSIYSSYINQHNNQILLLCIAFIIIKMGTVRFGTWIGAGDAYAMAWILLAQSLPAFSTPRWISNLGTYSMGIYVIHVLIIVGLTTVMRKIGLGYIIESIPALIMAFFYFVISWVAVVVLRRFKIPGL